jgi:hypothetical protein
MGVHMNFSERGPEGGWDFPGWAGKDPFNDIKTPKKVVKIPKKPPLLPPQFF